MIFLYLCIFFNSNLFLFISPFTRECLIFPICFTSPLVCFWYNSSSVLLFLLGNYFIQWWIPFLHFFLFLCSMTISFLDIEPHTTSLRNLFVVFLSIQFIIQSASLFDIYFGFNHVVQFLHLILIPLHPKYITLFLIFLKLLGHIMSKDGMENVTIAEHIKDMKDRGRQLEK